MTHYSNTRNPIDFPKKKDIPLLERFAAQSLVESDGELVFFKEKFAELIVRECADVGSKFSMAHPEDIRYQIKRHFGVEE